MANIREVPIIPTGFKKKSTERIGTNDKGSDSKTIFSIEASRNGIVYELEYWEKGPTSMYLDIRINGPDEMQGNWSSSSWVVYEKNQCNSRWKVNLLDESNIFRPEQNSWYSITVSTSTGLTEVFPDTLALRLTVWESELPPVITPEVAARRVLVAVENLPHLIVPLDAPAVREQAVHIVKRGDYLRQLATKYYKDAALWPVIYAANKKIIGHDPDILKIGLHLKIPRL